MNIKIGIGEDSHRFAVQKKKLILGGVEIEGALGLEGNSDSDVVLHAICNAFDVVAGQGSIATYSDEMCERSIVDSAEYVKYIKNIAKEKGWKVQSAAISIEAKNPKLEPFSSKMKTRIAELLEISKEDVGLTFTSGEGLSEFGKGQGIKATLVATFIKF